MKQPAAYLHCYGRIVIAIGCIVALHAALLAFFFTQRDALFPVTARPLPTVAIQLINDNDAETPSVTPAAPVVQRRKPARVTIAPSHSAPASPAPSAPTPARTTATATAPASPLAPGQAREGRKSAGPSMMSAGTNAGVPKNVAHVDCHIARPEYRDSDESGTVSVHFIVETTGKISHAEIRSSSGSRSLDNAALAATRNGSCRPYVENGRALRVAATQPFRFGGEED